MWLNADIGEGMDTDLELYPFLDQASIACGGHTGDKQSMQAAVSACLEHQVSIGAHPSYPDRVNFGRQSIIISADNLVETLNLQIEALETVCTELNAEIAYIKPHGALYNDMMANDEIFATVLKAVAGRPKPLSLMIGAMPQAGRYAGIAETMGIKVFKEAFADRLYLSDGSLCPRTIDGAVLDDADEITAQANLIAEKGQVKTRSGELIELNADSLCIHGDNLASVRAAPAIANGLRSK